MRLTMAPYCAAIRPDDWVPAMPSACTVVSASSLSPRAGRGRENPDRGAGMPALADMLLAHAKANARTDLVAGDGRGEEIAAGQLRVALGNGDQRRQRHRADMEHRLAVHVVE